MLKFFLSRLATEIRDFIRQQIVVGLSVALIIVVNQFWTGQISRSGVRTSLWNLAIPYLLILATAVVYHAFRTLYLLWTEVAQSQGGPIILICARPIEKRSKWQHGRRSWILAFLVIVVLGYVSFFVSRRLKPQPPLPPGAPTLLEVSQEDDWEGQLGQEGQLSRAPLVSPCS